MFKINDIISNGEAGNKERVFLVIDKTSSAYKIRVIKHDFLKMGTEKFFPISLVNISYRKKIKNKTYNHPLTKIFQ